jgi:hypothetical protein
MGIVVKQPIKACKFVYFPFFNSCPEVQSVTSENYCMAFLAF